MDSLVLGVERRGEGLWVVLGRVVEVYRLAYVYPFS